MVQEWDETNDGKFSFAKTLVTVRFARSHAPTHSPAPSSSMHMRARARAHARAQRHARKLTPPNPTHMAQGIHRGEFDGFVLAVEPYVRVDMVSKKSDHTRLSRSTPFLPDAITINTGRGLAKKVRAGTQAFMEMYNQRDFLGLDFCENQLLICERLEREKEN